MKKLLLLIALIPSAILGVPKTVDFANQIANLTKMAGNHKKAWLEHERTCINGKLDLEEKHMKEWVEFKSKYINEMGKGTPVAKILPDKLHNMIKLHQAQNEEWAKMCKKHTEDAGKIAEKQKTEFQDFVKKVMFDVEKKGKIEVKQYGQVAQ